MYLMIKAIYQIVQQSPVLCQYMVYGAVESTRVQFCVDSPVESNFVSVNGLQSSGVHVDCVGGGKVLVSTCRLSQMKNTVTKEIQGIMRMTTCLPYMKVCMKNLGILHTVLQAPALVLS